MSNTSPSLSQKGIRNVVQNLKEPAVAVNDVLQGKMGHAWQSVQRLAVNSTAGVAGIFDVAEKLGVPPHKSDFGQTLAVWGVGEGPSSSCRCSAPRMRAMRWARPSIWR